MLNQSMDFCRVCLCFGDANQSVNNPQNCNQASKCQHLQSLRLSAPTKNSSAMNVSFFEHRLKPKWPLHENAYTQPVYMTHLDQST